MPIFRFCGRLRAIIYLTVLPLAALLYACMPGDCVPGRTPRLEIALISDFPNNQPSVRYQVDTAYKGVYVIGHETGTKKDSVPGYIQNNHWFLPLNAYDSTVGFVFLAGIIKDKLLQVQYRDTLIVKYTPQRYFESEECGFRVRFNNLRVAKHTFSDTAIVNHVVDSTQRLNINLYTVRGVAP
ncbi:MAG: DUF6452 family protein [Bacteroidota bacterium]